ncbi:hypothetical protein [Candidatus Pyrohabitans sp.]
MEIFLVLVVSSAYLLLSCAVSQQEANAVLDLVDRYIAPFFLLIPIPGVIAFFYGLWSGRKRSAFFRFFSHFYIFYIRRISGRGVLLHIHTAGIVHGLLCRHNRIQRSNKKEGRRGLGHSRTSWGTFVDIRHYWWSEVMMKMHKNSQSKMSHCRDTAYD